MKAIKKAFYCSMLIRCARKIILKLSGVFQWDEITGWTKLILSKQELADDVDGYDVFTYCPADGLYHGWRYNDELNKYEKVTAKYMRNDEYGMYLVRNVYTGTLDKATPVHLMRA